MERHEDYNPLADDEEYGNLEEWGRYQNEQIADEVKNVKPIKFALDKEVETLPIIEPNEFYKDNKWKSFKDDLCL